MTRNWRKSGPCYEVPKNLDEVYSMVLWKIDLVSDALVYLVEEISR